MLGSGGAAAAHRRRRAASPAPPHRGCSSDGGGRCAGRRGAAGSRWTVPCAGGAGAAKASARTCCRSAVAFPLRTSSLFFFPLLSRSEPPPLLTNDSLESFKGLRVVSYANRSKKRSGVAANRPTQTHARAAPQPLHRHRHSRSPPPAGPVLIDGIRMVKSLRHDIQPDLDITSQQCNSALCRALKRSKLLPERWDTCWCRLLFRLQCSECSC